VRKEGYIDNRGNYVRPGPDYQRLLMVALMNALAMLLAERMVSGLQFGSLLSLLLAALLFTVLNLSVKPVLQLAALPLTILTFGVFALVLNGFMLWLVVWLIPGCSVAGFGSAILASIVISLANLLITWIVGRL
jgi:putative membrane protein